MGKLGATMVKSKTSAEKARDDEEQSQLDNLLGDAFGDIGAIEHSPDVEEQTPVDDEEPSGPPTGPPTGPPSGPPTGPPTSPPSGPPSSPPSGPPTGPPTGPPSGPPSGPPTPESEAAEDASEAGAETPAEAPVEEPPSPDLDIVDVAPAEAPASEPELPVESEEVEDTLVDEPAVAPSVADEAPVAVQETGVDPATLTLLAEKEAELERLHMENARLRQSVVGATEVIEELEEPPMPPLVEDNFVIPAYIVSDFARLGRQLDREHLVRATMGSLATIHPEQPGVMISTKHMVTLPRMNERSLCAAPLGSTSPRGAPPDWHVLEVLLASVSVVTGGPASVIHMHGPHTTAASCEKDLVLLTPIDNLGKEHIGKIIIVDPDMEQPEDYLRQVAEALNQGGMRCVVVRGNGAYAVGADFDQAWANAAMLEHSMHIHLLARQANLKV